MSKEFSIEELRTLMRAVAENRIGELLYEAEGTRLRIRGQREQAASAAPAPVPTAVAVASAQSGGAAEAAPAAEPRYIKSPIVGTYYASSGPDKDPYVTVGSQVRKGEVVFIVESMKVMNEIPAETEGAVAEILVENGAPVEYGQPILRLE